MKTASLVVLGTVALMTLSIGQPWLHAAEPVRSYEYATIRWAGKENTHIIRPGGQVEFIGAELQRAQRPDRADERSFYMNLAMNGLTKEGYEFAGITNDEIVMKRAAGSR